MKKSQSINIVKTLLFLIILVFTNACGTINLVSEAQDDFNKAARNENATKFDSETLGLLQVGDSYDSAYMKINEALKKEGQLKNDGLLGTAYTLKALCEWKLGNYTLALTTRDLALKELSGQPRDEVIMKALPALIKTDQANAKLMASQKNTNNRISIELEEYNTIKAIIDGALIDYDEAIVGNSTHSIGNYIEMSKTSAVVILHRAAGLLSGEIGKKKRKEINEKYVIPRLQMLEKRFGKESVIYKQYKFILGQ